MVACGVGAGARAVGVLFERRGLLITEGIGQGIVDLGQLGYRAAALVSYVVDQCTKIIGTWPTLGTFQLAHGSNLLSAQPLNFSDKPQCVIQANSETIVIAYDFC
jgi:hypothetical protein